MTSQSGPDQSPLYFRPTYALPDQGPLIADPSIFLERGLIGSLVWTGLKLAIILFSFSVYPFAHDTEYL